MEKILGKKVSKFKISVHRVKKDLVTWLLYNELPFLSTSFNYFLNNRCFMNKNKKLYKEGYIKGQPDFFIPIANSKYNGLFIYLKLNENFLDRNTDVFIKILTKQNYKVIIAKSFDDVVLQIENYLNIEQKDNNGNNT